MKYLPTENITFKSKLKVDEVHNRLSKLVVGSTKKYEGQIDELTFEIKRIINYRNSWLPCITGTIYKDFDGTTIKVKMRMNIFVIIFICIWCGGVGFASVAIMTQTIDDAIFRPVVFGPLAMLLFMYVITTASFKYESKKAKKDLQEAFESELVDEQ